MLKLIGKEINQILGAQTILICYEHTNRYKNEYVLKNYFYLFAYGVIFHAFMCAYFFQNQEKFFPEY